MFRKREELKKELSDQEFDYVFYGVNLTTAFLCYSLALEGKKTALCQAGDFDREDHFQTTTIFPGSLRQFGKAVKQLDAMERLRRVYPHLILQQRVINTGMSAYRSRLLNTLFNRLVAGDPAKRSTLMELPKYPEYRHWHCRGLETAILSREYQVNINRLILEILKEAQQRGAVICNYIEIQPHDDQIMFRDQITGSEGVIKSGMNYRSLQLEPLIIVKEKTGGSEKISNLIRIPGSHRDYQIRVQANGHCHIEVTQVRSRENLSMVRILKEKNQIEQIVGQLEERDWERMSIRRDSGLSNSRDTLVDERIENFFNKKLPDFPLKNGLRIPEKSSGWSEPDYSIHHLSLVGDQLFDEARQTGIEQERFMELYYRYGTNIREITELAYEKMSGDENTPQKIWESAVNDIEKATAWKK